MNNNDFVIISNTIKVVRRVLRKGHYLTIAIVIALAYVVFYMFLTGIIQVSPEEIPETIKIPHASVTMRGAIGVVPWIVIYPDKHTVFSMTFSAMLSTVLNSLLVGLNSTLILYRYFISRFIQCPCNSVCGSPSLAGLVPSAFSLFACCGGGLLVAVFGFGILPSLRPYGYVFSLIGIAALAYGLFLNTKAITRDLFSNDKIKLFNI